MRPGRGGRRLAALPVGVGLVAVLLGWIGYLDAAPELSPSSALYRSLQLLVLEYSGPAADVPLTLELARFLATLVLAYALIALVVALARERVDRLRLRLGMRKHYVVIGLGAEGAAIATRLRTNGAPVVGVEADPAGSRIPGARSHGAPVVVGDGRDLRILALAQLQKASNVLIVAGDDSVNIEILARCEELLDRRERGVAVHVAIDDPFLWSQLHRRRLEREDQGLRIEFISFPDRIARQLVESSAATLAGPATERVLIWGRGPIAVRTAAHATRAIMLAGRRPELLVGGPDADGLLGDLASSEGWLVAAAHVAELEGADDDADIAFVAGLGEAEALAAGARIGEMLSQAREIVIAAPGEASRSALTRAGYDLTRVKLVPAHGRALDPELFEESALELIARAKHEDYVANELQRGGSVADNPSIAPWEELPESLKESNRLFAASVGRKLSELEAALAPLRTPGPAPLPLGPDDLDELAVSEHDRWVRDLSADGWRPTDGAKDPERRLHPLLVSWAELDERERDKDRDAIRALPTMLARLGFEISMSRS